MTKSNKEWWTMARRARDKLAALILNHPAISLIDIGKDDTGASDTPVLRVHVRQGDVSGLNIPRDVDGIPVRVVRGDYRPENSP